MGNGIVGASNTKDALRMLMDLGADVRPVAGTDEWRLSHPEFNNGRVVRVKVAGRKDTPRVLATMIRRLRK